MKKKIIITLVVMTLLMTITALAVTIKSPSGILSEITGIAEEQLQEQRQNGAKYGQIAEENGVAEEFKQSMLENKFAIIDERVAQGKLTQEEAEEFKNTLNERMESCTGECTENEKLGQQYNMRFGASMNNGQGLKKGTGKGLGNGNMGLNK